MLSFCARCSLAATLMRLFICTDLDRLDSFRRAAIHDPAPCTLLGVALMSPSRLPAACMPWFPLIAGSYDAHRWLMA
eukprot:SAG31_NODE_27182_length_430_cov_0.776435_2_plen_76_part_01